MRKYPKVNIELTLADRTLNLYDKNVDIGFVIGPIKDSSIIAKRMMPTWLKCFASPLFLETHGVPHHPSDLDNLPIIAYTEPIYGPSYRRHFEKMPILKRKSSMSLSNPTWPHRHFGWQDKPV